MFFLLYFGDNVFKSYTLVNLKWVEVISSLSCCVRVDDETFCGGSRKLCAIRAEGNVLDSNGKLNLAFEQIFCSFSSWHSACLGCGIRGPDIFV